MGQAKRRGTYEQRINAANIRNEEVKRLLAGSPQMQNAINKHGIQQVATKLTQSQLIPSVFQMQVAAAKVAMQRDTIDNNRS